MTKTIEALKAFKKRKKKNTKILYFLPTSDDSGSLSFAVVVALYDDDRKITKVNTFDLF